MVVRLESTVNQFYYRYGKNEVSAKYILSLCWTIIEACSLSYLWLNLNLTDQPIGAQCKYELFSNLLKLADLIPFTNYRAITIYLLSYTSETSFTFRNENKPDRL